MSSPDLHEANRHSWNAATAAHNSHKADQAAFLRRGGTTLFAEEVELLGDVTGKRLCHLQCNSGQDTLSIASTLGAKATGVDISDEAIRFAQRLSEDSGIPATFHRTDVYDYLGEVEPSSFDTVFLSYGALCWLSDLDRWATGVARLMRPGGRLVIVEFHPCMMVFDMDLRARYDGIRVTDQAAEFPEGIGDYVGRSGEALTPMGRRAGVSDFDNPHPSYEWTWSTAGLTTVILAAGLRLQTLRDWPHVNGWKGVHQDGTAVGPSVHDSKGLSQASDDARPGRGQADLTNIRFNNTV